MNTTKRQALTRRLTHLRKDILALTSATGIDTDAGMDGGDEDNDLAKLDEYLCELKEAQIRDGLHIFGTSPEGRLETDLIAALARVPRADGTHENASIQRAIANDLCLEFDPLDCKMSDPWTGPRPQILLDLDTSTWRTVGDTVERIETLTTALIDGREATDLPTTNTVLDHINTHIRPTVRAVRAI